MMALVMALWEIQIEGIYGWAQKLPTQRFRVGERVVWTNYHSYFALFSAFAFHYPFLYHPWCWSVERKILSDYCRFFILEDMLWFICNHDFRIAKMKDWWREPKIMGSVPVFYLPVLFLSFGFDSFSSLWIEQFGLELLCTRLIRWTFFLDTWRNL